MTQTVIGALDICRTASEDVQAQLPKHFSPYLFPCVCGLTSHLLICSEWPRFTAKTFKPAVAERRRSWHKQSNHAPAAIPQDRHGFRVTVRTGYVISNPLRFSKFSEPSPNTREPHESDRSRLRVRLVGPSRPGLRVAGQRPNNVKQFLQVKKAQTKCREQQMNTPHTIFFSLEDVGLLVAT